MGLGIQKAILKCRDYDFSWLYRMSMLSNNVPSRHCCIGPLSVVMLLGRADRLCITTARVAGLNNLSIMARGRSLVHFSLCTAHIVFLHTVIHL